MKIGTLGIVLAALEAGVLPVLELADPVAAFRSVSRAWGRPVALADGRSMTPLDVQNAFWEACSRFVGEQGYPEGAELIEAWRGVLDDLAKGPEAVADRVEWAARLELLDAVRRRKGTGFDDAAMAALDLAWADIEPARSPRAVLERKGRFRDLPVDAAPAMTEAPDDTRAWLRGLFVTRHPDAVVAAGWESILVRDSRGGLHTLRMSDPYGSRIRAAAKLSGGLDMLIHTVEEVAG